MQEKVIVESNFVKFMHDVINSVKEGYILTLEPKHAPSSANSYSITLVKTESSEENLNVALETAAILEEKVDELIENSLEEAPVEKAVEEGIPQEAPKKQGRPARK